MKSPVEVLYERIETLINVNKLMLEELRKITSGEGSEYEDDDEIDSDDVVY